MKINKILFTSTMMMGTTIAVSSYSWMTMWMGLEMNLLSIIPLFSEKKNVFASEAAMKYFVTQAMASLILLTAIIMLLSTEEFINPLMNFSLTMMMNTAFLTKLGAAPMHFWFPEVIEGLSWINSLILLTWQKIAPMMLLMSMNINKMFLATVMMSCLIISTISSFSQVSLRKIMAFSSINHMAWMMATMYISMSTWLTYFIIYSYMNMNISMIFKKTKSFYLNQINNVMNQDKQIKFCLLLNFLSMGGIPPFVGFLPKWLVINWMTNMNMLFMTTFMIATTLIMLFIYIRIMMSSMMLYINEPKTINVKINSKLIMFLNMIMLPSLILCTLMFNVM